MGFDFRAESMEFDCEIKLEGIVTNMKRSKINWLVLSISGSKRTDEAELPIKIGNDFELIPYQHALLDKRVKYLMEKELIKRGGSDIYQRRYTLEVISSGPLLGKTYNYAFPK